MRRVSLFFLCFGSGFPLIIRARKPTFSRHSFTAFSLLSPRVSVSSLSFLSRFSRPKSQVFSSFQMLAFARFFSLKSKVLTGFLFVGICPQKPTFFRHSFVAFSLRSP
jgi:hypothetical protein